MLGELFREHPPAILPVRKFPYGCISFFNSRERAEDMARKTRTEDPAGTAPGDASENSGSRVAQTDTETQGSSPGAGIADSAKQAASQAKEAAGRVIEQAKDQATSRAEERRQSVATGFEAVAHAFRSMGDDLRNQEKGPVAEYAAEIGNAMGGQVERLANYLQGRDVHQLVTDAEDFARRSPAVFLGSAFVLGLAASRFLKSSRPTSGSGSSQRFSPSSRGAVEKGFPEMQSPPALTDGTLDSALQTPSSSDRGDQSIISGNPGSGSGLDRAGGI